MYVQYIIMCIILIYSFQSTSSRLVQYDADIATIAAALIGSTRMLRSDSVRNASEQCYKGSKSTWERLENGMIERSIK